MSLLRTLVHVPRPRNGWFSSSALGDKCLICVGASLLCPEYKMMRYQSGSCRLLSMTQWLVVDNTIVRKHWRTSYQHSAHRSPLSLRHVAHTVREEFGTVVVCTDDTGVSIINVISHSETTQMLHCFTRVALKLALLWLIYQMWQNPVYVSKTLFWLRWQERSRIIVRIGTVCSYCIVTNMGASPDIAANRHIVPRVHILST